MYIIPLAFTYFSIPFSQKNTCFTFPAPQKFVAPRNGVVEDFQEHPFVPPTSPENLHLLTPRKTTGTRPPAGG